MSVIHREVKRRKEHIVDMIVMAIDAMAGFSKQFDRKNNYDECARDEITIN